jgi:branched-chain amino acid aminotransferase
VRIWVGTNHAGELRAEADARVSVLDHGFTVGDGVFETLKVEAGSVFAITRHLIRLTHSARGLGLPDPDHDTVRRAIAETVAANSPPDFARMRVTYTGGAAPLGSERGAAAPTLTVAVGPVPRPAPAIKAVTVPWTRNERSALAGLKTTSYGENVVALARARAAGAGEALFADTQGRLSEGTGTNVFVVVDGQLFTPSLDAGCLAGITRALVIEAVGTVVEADLAYEVLGEADEVFLTSTLRDVQAVIEIDGLPIGVAGEIGPLTMQARSLFLTRSAACPDPR